MPMFFLQAIRTARQAAAAEGNLAVRTLQERKWVFWTATMWTNEAAMRAYMVAGAHGKVMRKLLEWCDEASVTHWTQESADLPDWPEAYARLKAEGRKSKVKHPSAAHNASEIPPPAAGPKAGMRLK